MNLEVILRTKEMERSNREILHAGWKLYINCEYTEAIDLYTEVLNRNPTKGEIIDALNRRALAYRSLQKVKEAFADLDKALQLDQNYFLTYLHLGILFDLDFKEYDMAESSYLMALKLKPDVVQALNNYAACLSRKKKWLEAKSYLEQALKIDPQYVDAINNHRVVLLSLGIEYLLAEDYQKAETEFNLLLAIDPNNYEAVSNRAVTRKKLGNFQGALNDYFTAIKLVPMDYRPYHNRGLLYQEMGEIDLSIADQMKALNLNPSFGKAHLSLALCYASKGDKAGFSETLKKAICLFKEGKTDGFSKEDVKSLMKFSEMFKEESDLGQKSLENDAKLALIQYIPELGGEGTTIICSSIEEIEQKSLGEMAESKHAPQVPFGYMNREWEYLKSLYQDGDFIFHYSTNMAYWESQSGREGYALVRGKKVVTQITTRLN